MFVMSMQLGTEMCAAAAICMSLPVVQDGPGNGSGGVGDVVPGVSGVVRMVYKMTFPI